MNTQDQYQYRIFTEGKNSDAIFSLISDCFDGFTVYHGSGFWQNTIERNLTIEIITPENQHHTIKMICKQINAINNQKCCLVTIDRIEVAFV